MCSDSLLAKRVREPRAIKEIRKFAEKESTLSDVTIDHRFVKECEFPVYFLN